MKWHLLHNEKVIADQGYPDAKCSRDEVTGGSMDFEVVRARLEATNKRLKQLSALGTRFRYKLDLHSECFLVVLNLVQLSVEKGKRMFRDDF